ncbi:MAG: FecR domain-containing protein [Porphyromonadaceae bacterium]|nr:FecR domain-containing protein [Porphyromonadaceae bacterium]
MKLNLDYKDFLCDDLFVYWRIHPTAELTSFWEKFISQNEHLREPFQHAIAVFAEIQQPHGSYLPDEVTVSRELQDRINRFRKKKLRMVSMSSAAAILLVALITALYTVTRRENTFSDKQMASIGAVMIQDKVQLITGNQVVDMENNATVFLTEKENALIRDSLSRKEIDLKKNQSNKLIVPFGKRSSVILADGSAVHVNSGTELDFPSVFTGQTREISVKGEIFIDVAKQRQPFIIHTPQSQITVYGTSFNVSSYTDEKNESVVLVDGSVHIKSDQGALMLKPGEMAEVNNGNIQRKQVDVMEYISWKSGYMQLNKNSLTEVLKKIGRYYNVEFNYAATLNLQNQTCSGKLFLSENLDDVLQSFSRMTFLQYNKISDGTVYIQKTEQP